MAGQRLTHWDRIPAVHKDFYQVDQTILKGFRMDYAGMTNLDSSDKKKTCQAQRVYFNHWVGLCCGVSSRCAGQKESLAEIFRFRRFPVHLGLQNRTLVPFPIFCTYISILSSMISGRHGNFSLFWFAVRQNHESLCWLTLTITVRAPVGTSRRGFQTGAGLSIHQ